MDKVLIIYFWQCHANLSSLTRVPIQVPCSRSAEFEPLDYQGIPSKFVLDAAKSHQSCPTLCDPIDGSPPGSPVPGILQARTLEWVAISFSNAWKWKVKVKSLSCVQLLATLWTVAYQAPLSMGFSRQEDWSGVPLPSPPRQFNNWYESFSFWLTNIESLGNRTWIITSSWSICHYPAMKLNLESSVY